MCMDISGSGRNVEGEECEKWDVGRGEKTTYSESVGLEVDGDFGGLLVSGHDPRDELFHGFVVCFDHETLGTGKGLS